MCSAVQEKNPNGKSLFEAEQKELLNSLYDIPQVRCRRLTGQLARIPQATRKVSGSLSRSGAELD